MSNPSGTVTFLSCIERGYIDPCILCNKIVPGVICVQAMAAYRTAARRFPGLASPLLGMALEYGRMSNTPLALRLLQQAAALCPEEPQARFGAVCGYGFAYLLLFSFFLSYGVRCTDICLLPYAAQAAAAGGGTVPGGAAGAAWLLISSCCAADCCRLPSRMFGCIHANNVLCVVPCLVAQAAFLWRF